jgi:hypothetical protein
MQHCGCKSGTCPGTDNRLHHGMMDPSRDMTTDSALHAKRGRFGGRLANCMDSAEYGPTGQSDRSQSGDIPRGIAIDSLLEQISCS